VAGEGGHHLVGDLGHLDLLHGVPLDETFSVQEAEEGAHGAGVGLDELQGDCCLHGPCVGVAGELVPFPKRDDEAPQVVAVDFRNVLVVTEEGAEISKAGRYPPDGLGAFAFGLSEDTVSCQCVR